MELDKIYCEDCLETLKRMDDNSIDLIITSPPYNKGYWSANRNPKSGFFRTKSRRIDYGVYEDCMEPEEYERWQREILDECTRVIKPTGSIFYNHKPLYRDINEINPTYIYDYPLKQTIIWNRNSTAMLSTTAYFYTFFEYLFWLKKDKEARPYFNRKLADFQSSIWKIMPAKNNSHPAPFPIELPTNIIKCCSKEGDVVYDPFMGSGTVALAARNLGRHYIGSELNPDYIIMANERLGML